MCHVSVIQYFCELLLDSMLIKPAEILCLCCKKWNLTVTLHFYLEWSLFIILQILIWPRETQSLWKYKKHTQNLHNCKELTSKGSAASWRRWESELPQMSGKKLSRKVEIMVPLSRKTWSCVTKCKQFFFLQTKTCQADSLSAFLSSFARTCIACVTHFFPETWL